MWSENTLVHVHKYTYTPYTQLHHGTNTRIGFLHSIRLPMELNVLHAKKTYWMQGIYSCIWSTVLRQSQLRVHRGNRERRGHVRMYRRIIRLKYSRHITSSCICARTHTHTRILYKLPSANSLQLSIERSTCNAAAIVVAAAPPPAARVYVSGRTRAYTPYAQREKRKIRGRDNLRYISQHWQ